MLKEELIGKKINDLFKEKEQKMIRTVEVAIYENNHEIYNFYRKEYESKLDELEKERAKLLRRKKNKKEKAKLLKQNSVKKFRYIATILNNTVKHFKQMYYENDYYRQKKLIEIEEEANERKEEAKKNKLKQLQDFFNSPFRDDKRFAITFIAQYTRDKLQDSNQIVDKLFFDKIFDLMITTDDERNKLKSFEILCNLINHDSQRSKLANNNYFERVFQSFKISQADARTLEKLSWMCAQICFYPDMIDQIIKLKILDIIIELSGPQYQTSIRSNAVLAISLLTYHEKMFEELIKRNVIDLVLDLCRDSSVEIQVKQYSTLALVHFALNKQSINILIEKKVMDLFNSFATIDNAVIQTNISWIFLALCNNGITGKMMLENGITRDMFLVSCNPQFNQIRHLVIAGFAELGRCIEIQTSKPQTYQVDIQKIKETAIVGMHKIFKEQDQISIDILLKFSVSKRDEFKNIAFWALKDYILLNHDNLVPDISGIIQVFVNGCIYDNEDVKTECANALSFLITHHLVYNENEKINDHSFILDALMLLTGSDSKFIRTRAFSTLSTLSTYSSDHQKIMDQIHSEIKLPPNTKSPQYLKLITERLQENLEKFELQNKAHNIENKFSGLFSLLHLAKHPSQEAVKNASYLLNQFIRESENKNLNKLNEGFFMYVFKSLKHSKNTEVLDKLMKVIRFYIKYNSPYQVQIINPDTILWLLEVAENNRSNKALSCKSAMTLLKIVSHHQIVFDYQEVAIIKKFNLALQNLDVFDDSEGTFQEEVEKSSNSVSDEMSQRESCGKPDLKSEAEQVKVGQNEEQKAAAEIQIVEEKDHLKEIQIRVQTSENKKRVHDSFMQAIPDTESELQQFGNELSPSKIAVPRKNSNYTTNSPVSRPQTQKKSSNKRFSIYLQQDIAQIAKKRSSKQNLIESKLNDSTNQEEIKHMNRNTEIEIGSFNQMKQHIVNRMQTTINQHLVIKQNSSVQRFSQIKSKTIKKNLMLFSNKSNFTQKSKEKMLVGNADSSYAQDLDLDDESEASFEKLDEGTLDSLLRDSLIKAFMVIFTHDNSQHLLLNKDLIDIAFNCMEFCADISIEAKQKLAKLISIIFKFPQVQEKLLSQEVIIGINHLLEQKDDAGIMRNTVKACTYLSMNYEFVSTNLSLDILKNLMPLLNTFSGTDQYNLIFTIANILKGDPQNKMYFYEHQGADLFYSLIVKSSDPKILEICITSIKELTAYKVTLRGMVAKDKEMLEQVIIKCLEFTDNWKNNSPQNLVLTSQSQDNKENMSSLQFEESSNESVIQEEQDNPREKAKNLLQLLRMENQVNSSFIQLTSIPIQIRNNIFYSISRLIKHGFSLTFLRDEALLIQRIISDLRFFGDNQALFENLLLVLNSIEVDPNFINEVFAQKYKTFIRILYDYKNTNNRVSFLKVIINLILRAQAQLADNVNLFENIFRLIEEHKDCEVQENIVWLIGALIEQACNEKVIKIFYEFNVVEIIVKHLESHNERNILQSLKTLSTILIVPSLQYRFFEQNCYQQLLNIAQNSYQKYNLEIKTSLNQLLGVLTTNKDIRKNLFEIGFLHQLITDIKTKDYQVEEHLKEDDFQQYQSRISQIRYSKPISSLDLENPLGDFNDLIIDDEYLDDIDRAQNSNKLVESVAETLANFSLDQETHQEFLNEGILQALDLIMKHFLSRAVVTEEDPNPKVDFQKFDLGAIKLGKSMSVILLNLTTSTDQIQEIIDKGIVDMLKKCVNLQDYDIQTNVFLSFGNLLLNSNQEVRKQVEMQGCGEIVEENVEGNQYLRVQRICRTIIAQKAIVK